MGFNRILLDFLSGDFRMLIEKYQMLPAYSKHQLSLQSLGGEVLTREEEEDDSQEVHSGVPPWASG